MCHNHVTAIPAANHSQQLQFKSREPYEAYYDEVVHLALVGHETIAVKCDEAMVVWMCWMIWLVLITMTRRGLFQVGTEGFLWYTEGMGGPPLTRQPRQDGKMSA